ncbi:MAG: phosphonate transport system substrate-binding protein [Planctomycetota bacterium]
MISTHRPTGVDTSTPLNAVTYLAPGIPSEFFEFVTEHIARALNREVKLSIESRISGPMHGDEDPFSCGKADLGFVCSPSYLFLKSRPKPSIVLVPAGFVFEDARNEGRPVYFSDVIVRRDHRAKSFDELRGGLWGYNDECSLSGYFSTLQELAERGMNREFFDDWIRTGSHGSSIEGVLNGRIDGAAIDSIALAAMQGGRAEMMDTLRVVDSFGPYPTQPVVLRAALQETLLGPLTEALLSLSMTPPDIRRPAGFERCVPIEDADFDEEHQALMQLPSFRR